MKHALKRTLAVFLAVIMVFGGAPLSALAGLDLSWPEWLNSPFSFGASATHTWQVGDIGTFGSYPQTRVTDVTLLTALNAQTLTWVSYGYYSGTGEAGTMTQSDYMKYADVTYNGNKYRAVKLTAYRPRETTYPLSGLYSIQDEYGYLTNTIYWFKYEPLKWRVLAPSTGLVVCENLIDSQAYCNTIYKSDGYYYNNTSCTAYACDYATSSIRTWLNGIFMQTAFSNAEQTQIPKTHLDNSSASGYTEFDSADTDDKAFLLSYNDMLNTSYGFSADCSSDDNARLAHGSDYAMCQGLYFYLNLSANPDRNAFWRLRSPGINDFVSYVSGEGRVSDSSGADETLIGIRPALRVSNLSYLTFVSSGLHTCQVGDIGTFGSYPQTRVTDATLLTALNAQTLNWVSYGYYSGPGTVIGTMTQSDYMKYADVMYNGSKYRAVKFTSYRPYLTFYASTLNATYQDDNGYVINTVYWFKYEPLKWRVLDPATGLVVCENLIDSQAYSNTIYWKDINGDNGRDENEYFNNAPATVYANDYATSSIRTWLNDDFYNTAFTSAEQSNIQTTMLDNSAWPGYSQYNSVSTNDKLFLLSYSDSVNTAYGFSSSTSLSSTRYAQGSDYANCQGLDNYSSSYDGSSDWFLRSSGDDSSHASHVYYNGFVSNHFNVFNTDMGIRPAFRISNLSSLTYTSSEAVPVTGVYLDKESLSLTASETSQLTAIIEPSNATNKSVTWTSSNSNVATVNSNGLVSAKASGTATITVTANDTTNGTLSDTCSIIMSTDASNVLIDRVSQYCEEFDSEEFEHKYNTWDLTKPSNLNELITEYNKAEDSYKERWDLIRLAGHDGFGGNEPYAAWQYKEYINNIGVRTVLGLGGLVYNGEAVGYIVGEWAEKDKYKDALKKYMSTCSTDIELLSYIDDTFSFLDDLAKVSGDVTKINKIRQLQSNLRGCITSLDVDNLLYNFNFSSNGFDTLTIDYKNNALSKALGNVGDVIQIAQITAEGIIDLMSVSNNLKIYEIYGDFLSGIASDLSLPCALRVAANELNQGINQQYAQALLDISQEIGKAVVSSGGSEILSASTLAASTALSSVLIGISIGKFLGNIFLGIDEIVKASAYVECYALLSEKYSNIVLQDKNVFNSSPIYVNAQKFRDDYIYLWNLRLLGEETYRDMVGFEKLWSKKIKNTMRSWSGFEEKNAFVSGNIEQLQSSKFTMENDVPIRTIDLVKTYTNTVIIACPVNVRVYNESNVLIGSVTNNVLDSGISDPAKVPLVIYVSDDMKIIKIPEGANYRIEVSAFAEGEMSYTIEETDEDHNVLKRTNYYSLNIDAGDCFVINDTGASSPDFHTLYSVDNNTKTKMTPSETFTGNSIANATVNISVDVVNGGYVYGNGKYQKGDMVSLIATPEQTTTFEGWYDGNTLISSDDMLSFVATEDRQLRASFCTKATVLNGISLSAESLSLQYKGESKLTVTFSPTTATNKNVTWTSSNEKVAIVDVNGNVTATGRGTATITATTEDGGKTANCTVTVKLVWWQWLIKIILFGWIWY